MQYNNRTLQSLSRPCYTLLWHPITNKLYHLSAGVIPYVREECPWQIIIVPIYEYIPNTFYRILT
jgi:hypothetical protein